MAEQQYHAVPSHDEIHSIATARNWFETQAAEFRCAGVLIAENGVDPEQIRSQIDPTDELIRRSAHLKAIDALTKTIALRKFDSLTPGTDIYEARIRQASIVLLTERAKNAIRQADRRETEVQQCYTAQ